MTNELRIPKSERTDDLDQFGSPNADKPRSVKISAQATPFGVRHWSFLRISSFARRAEGRRRRVIRHSVLVGLLVLLAFSAALYGQTNAAKSQGNRFLFIVDTSASMQMRKVGMLNAVNDLMSSGMHGQLRAGDTVGLWTFNQEAYVGRFALQHWSRETQAMVTSHLLNFLNMQQYERTASLDKVLTLLDRVVKGSAYLTAILITDGEDKIHGTPFDDAINAYYKQWRKQQQKDRSPFVTVLRAKDGRITDYAVTSPPWPLEMPALPPELRAPDAARMANQAAVPAARTGGDASTNAEPAGSAVFSDLPGTAPAERAAPVLPLDSASPSGAKPMPASAESSGPTPAIAAAATPTPAAGSAADKRTEPPDTNSTRSAPVPTPPSNIVTNSSSQAAASIQAIVVTPSPAFFQRKVVLVGGLLLMGTALGLGFFLKRRARAADRVSLITRSLEREKE